jgi:crossover junction endodeoxyribonuclease RuvC
MLILGIDPGTAITGYGVVNSEGGKISCVVYGCVRTEANKLLIERLKEIYDQLSEIIDTYSPEAAALEKLFFNKNVRTALAVGQARGVAVLSVANARLPLFEYTPLQVKQAVVGYGRASKQQIQQMVKMILNLKEIPKPDDAADALAVAICHIHSAKYQRMIAKNT